MPLPPNEPPRPRSRPPASDNGQPYQPVGGGRRPEPPQSNRSSERERSQIPNFESPPRPPAPDQFFNPGQPTPRSRRQSRSRRNIPAQVAIPDFTPARRPPRRLPWKPILGYGLLIGLVAAVLIGSFVATRLFGFLNNISVTRQDVNGQAITSSSVTGHGRLNILVLGLDRRPNDAEGTRSDTMLLVSLDQDTKAVNVLSIPRDLWLKIPGHGNNRINTAYFFGDQDRPGEGGPPLAKQAVLDNFGVRVDYFVEVDFNGFRSIVDALGGITLDVKKPLIDNEYPTEDYGIKRIYIPTGLQHMTGEVALEYARSRHGGSDLDRNQRQQDVLLAVREQGGNLGILTNSQLQTALAGAIKTDLAPSDMLALGQVALGVKREAIKQFSIGANIAHQATIEGNDVLQADPTALAQLMKDFQSSSSPAQPQPIKETATISVLNGTFTGGRAARTQKFLESKGYTIISIDQATDAGKYPQSVINVYTGKQQTATELAGALGLKPNQIKTKSGGPPGIDLEVICGDDLNLPDQP